MAEIFDHVDDLPAEPHDGTAAGIRIPSGSVEHLVYHAAQDAWVGRAHWTMRISQNEGIYGSGASADWKYPGTNSENPGMRLEPITPYGFQIHKVLHGGEYWAAGLRLQEHLAGQLKPITLEDGPTGAETGQVALAWYPLADGDSFLSPDPSFNHGVRLVASNTADDRTYKHFSSGWQNTELDTEPAVDEHLYPEIYMLGPQTNLRELSARHRWAAGTLGGAGSGEQASVYPIDKISGWYQAEQIYVPDDDPVAEWGDWSGRSIALKQSDASKRPVVMTDSGIRFVRFNGSDDILRARLMNDEIGGSGKHLTVVPYMVFMVIRQRAAGATQQVWLGNHGGGATLIYRGDATNQVNYWSGGSDATYDRGSSWPSPWMVWSSSLLADGSLTIWEGATPVFTGSAGTGGFSGIVVGNNDGETLPAALDIAELIIVDKAPATGEREAVVDYLETKYGL